MTDTAPLVEEVDYDVTLVIRLTTHIYFAPIERSSPITRSDALENAWGLIPENILNEIESGFGGEFDVDLGQSEAMRDG